MLQDLGLRASAPRLGIESADLESDACEMIKVLNSFQHAKIYEKPTEGGKTRYAAL